MLQAEKDILNEAAANATAFMRKGTDERVGEMRKTLVDNGMTMLGLPDETKQAMKLKAQPVYDRIRNSVQDDDLKNS